MAETAPETPPEGIQPFLQAARAGSVEALGQLLEQCRQYLLGVANRELESALQPKAGASDLVQETFALAQHLFSRFQGDSERELLAWLRAILLNVLAELTRQYRGTAMRQLGREVALDALCDSDGEILASAPGDPSTPSGVVARDEEAEAVRAALARLPDHYRQVLVWREWDGLTFGEIGARLNRSEDAVRMLWGRAIERLQHELEPP